MSRAVGSELYKDKIEVSLDGRQIFYLFFGGAVIVGMVFVLGVMVGRRVEARGHIDHARVETAVDPLAALDRLEGGAGLSFQGALRGGEPPASDVEKAIAQMKKKPDEKKDKKMEPKVDVKVEEKKVEPKQQEKKAEIKSDEKKLEDKKSEPKSEDKKVADKKAEPKADDKKTDEKSEKKSKFTLQLSSFQDKVEAQAYLDQIKGAGFQAYVTEGAVDGKQYYRVRLGSYRTVEAANDAKAEFEKSAKKSAIVTKL